MATIYWFFLKLHDVYVENLYQKLESVLMRTDPLYFCLPELMNKYWSKIIFGKKILSTFLLDNLFFVLWIFIKLRYFVLLKVHCIKAATLFFVTGEKAIQHLFSRNTHLEFGYSALIVFLIIYFFLACWASGTHISCGIVVPMLLIGKL